VSVFLRGHFEFDLTQKKKEKPESQQVNFAGLLSVQRRKAQCDKVAQALSEGRKMDMTGTFVAAGIGAIVGAGAGFFGSGLPHGLVVGALAGGAVGFVFSLLPRSPGEARVPIESFSPAGALAGLFAGIVTSAGWVATLIATSAGWTLGLIIPAAVVGIVVAGRKQQQNKWNFPSEVHVQASEAKDQRRAEQLQDQLEKMAAVTEIYADVFNERPLRKVLRYDPANYPADLTLTNIDRPLVSDKAETTIPRRDVERQDCAASFSLPKSSSFRLLSVAKSRYADQNLKAQLSISEVELLTSQITSAQSGAPGTSAKPKTSSLEISFSASSGDIQLFCIDRMLFKQTPEGWLSWELPSEVTAYWRLRF
jgi:hypothetical protein